MRILIADDAAVARSVLRNIARGLHHEIVGEALNAREAQALSEATRPELAIVDGRLPPAGALGLIASLAAQGIDVLVVASLAETGLARAAVAAGARGALLRPLLVSQVGATLEGLARTPQPQREERPNGSSHC